MTQEVLKMARQLLWRYRHETPIGNQPYMICHAADEAFERIDEALAQEQEPVAWGVDWGRAGDIPCVSIIKRLPNGGIEVVAVEYAPYTFKEKNSA